MTFRLHPLIQAMPDGSTVGPVPGASRRSLREQVQLRAALFDAVGLPVFAVGADWEMLYCNTAGEQILGWDATQVVGRNLTQLSILDDLEVDAVDVIRQVAENGSWTGTHWARHSDGRRLMLTSRLTALRDVGGQFLAAVVVSTDDTAGQLAQSEVHRLSMLVESICDARYETALDGTITSWGEGAENLHGYTADQAIGQKVSMLCAGGAAEKAALGRLFAAAESITGYRFQGLRKDGSRCTVSLTLAPVYDDMGCLKGTTAIALDVTEQELLRAELESERERRRLAQQMAQIGTIELNLKTGEFWMSDEYCRIHALSGPNRYTRQGWMESIHPEDRDYVERESRNLERDGGGTEMVYRVLHPEGALRWVATRASIRKDRTGTGDRLFGTTMDITERRRHEEALKRMAYEDELTGLPNRTYLNEHITRALAAAANSGAAVGVMFVDINGLQHINDGMGHSAGDSMIIQLAERLSSQIGPHDIIARFAGGGFVIVCDDTNEQGARAVAERVSAAVRHPFNLFSRKIFTTVCIGIALSEPGDTAESLLDHAGVAMYWTKKAGLDQAVVFDEKMAAAAQDRLRIRSQLPGVVERGELQMHYQPIMDLTTGTVAGVEALIRWHHPEYGLISPDRFIPIAEETGHIVAIGDWTLRRSLEDLCLWRHQFPNATGLRIAVNLSARQLLDPQLPDKVRSAIESSGIDPQALEFEITESVLMSDVRHCMEVLTELRSFGIGISIDDFGTGYSSLSYLSRLPVTTLKIDRSFVRGLDIEGERCARPIIEAVISMARALDLDVVAEGVETHQQLQHLISLGAAQGQGYFWSPALAPAELAVWLEEQAGMIRHN
ncbi:EAL domain-containing protein [Arthrobacter sp.]|uniref:sensor domain-containing protein n=1 Tax=Arthrobacter sp. TaxID=1667 RepID=UPI00339998B6